jgi:hypothetical protein
MMTILTRTKPEENEMKLFIVSTDDYGYDDYDSHVIAANDENEAKEFANLNGSKDSWKVEEIGKYNKEVVGIIHSSFNAG